MPVLFTAGVSFIIALGLIPLIRRIAVAKGWYDPVDVRKIHHGNIPRLGGVGIFWAFMAGLSAAAVSHWGVFSVGPGQIGLWGLVFGGLGLHLLGLVDDFRDIRARYKFAVQLAVAVCLVGLGFRFKVLLLPFGDGVFELGWISIPLTLFWIIGVTNAMNLIDGMDGLGGGIALIAAAVFGVFFLHRGNASAALVCFALVGALGGFLVFNLPAPQARIFMGDSGSLFLGFILSILPLLGPAQDVVEIGLVSAVTILLIPIFDTLTAIIRRTRAGVSFFNPDKRHLHHKLLLIGLSPRRALAVIYGAALFLGAVALSGLFLPSGLSFWLKIGSWFLYAGLFIALHYASTPKKRPVDQEVAADRPEVSAAPLERESAKESVTI